MKALGHIEGMQGEVDYEYDGFMHSLEFRNRGSIELSDLSIQYRCFYEIDKQWRGVQQAGVSQRGKHVSKVEFEKGSFKISSLGAAKKHKKEVGPFVLTSWQLAGDHFFTGDDPEKADSSLLGLWVRVSFTTPDGRNLIRDFCDPKTLSQKKKVNW